MTAASWTADGICGHPSSVVYHCWLLLVIISLVKHLFTHLVWFLLNVLPLASLSLPWASGPHSRFCSYSNWFVKIQQKFRRIRVMSYELWVCVMDRLSVVIYKNLNNVWYYGMGTVSYFIIFSQIFLLTPTWPPVIKVVDHFALARHICFINFMSKHCLSITITVQKYSPNSPNLLIPDFICRFPTAILMVV